MGAMDGLDLQPVIAYLDTLKFGSPFGMALTVRSFNGKTYPLYSAVGPLK